MYGCFVTEPEDDGADLGVVFFHNAGYSTACGHGTIALVTWAVERVSCPPGSPRRAWRRRALGTARDGAPGWRAGACVRFGSATSLRSWSSRRSRWRRARAPSSRTSRTAAPSTRVDDARSIGLTVEPAALPRLIELGREVKRLVECLARRRPSERARAARRLRRRSSSRTRTTALRSSSATSPSSPTARSIARPAGAARPPASRFSTARAGFRAARRSATRASSAPSLRQGSSPTPRSPGRAAVVTEVEGSAYRTGTHRFVLDPDDPIGDGFLLR